MNDVIISTIEKKDKNNKLVGTVTISVNQKNIDRFLAGAGAPSTNEAKKIELKKGGWSDADIVKIVAGGITL